MNGRMFLEAVLEQPTDSELIALVSSLVSNHAVEDTWLDYKDGRWTDKVDTAELRRDVTAFGNSDGGCLVIGVSETGKRPTGYSSCTGDLARAVQQVDGVLASVAGLLFPPPRAARCVTIPTGEHILVIAVPRSGRLASVSESGQSAYFVRMADGKQRVPDYLLSDLFFGRRQQAALHMRVASCQVDEFEIEIQDIRINLALENHGPHFAHRLYGGVLLGSYDLSGVPFFEMIEPKHPAHPKVAWSISSDLTPLHKDFDHHFSGKASTLRPLQARELRYWARLPMTSDVAVHWRSAVYVGTDSGPTQWWEIEATIAPYAAGAEVTAVEVLDRLPRVSGL